MFLSVLYVSEFSKMKELEIFKACFFSYDFPMTEARFKTDTDPKENFERPKIIEVALKETL